MDRRQVLLSGAAIGLGVTVPGMAVAAGGAERALNKRFDSLSEVLLARSPETATGLGLDNGKRAGLKSRMADVSWASVQSLHQLCRDELAGLKTISDAGLSHEAALNKAVVTYALELGLEGARFEYGDNTLESAMSESAGPYVVSQQGGAYAGAAEFLDSQHAVETKSDAEAYLARLRGVATQIRAETDRVRADASKGVIAPDFILSNALGQMDGMLTVSAKESRFVSSIANRAKAKGIAGDYAAMATKIVEAEIYPALTAQRDQLRANAAKAGHDAGVWRLPDGEAYYGWLLKQGTNTTLSANEIHQIGLQQNRAIADRMDGLLRAQGLTQGSVGERMIAMGNDPKFLYPNTDEGRAQILTYLRAQIDSIRPRLSSQFTLNMKAPVEVKRVPPDIQDGAGLGYMNTGSLDGKRPSTYYINLKSTADWPKFQLPTLTFHETIPGHAWQGAYPNESGGVPLIRNLLSGFNAYVEGYALYAEQLGDEMGMYENDWAGQLGYLQFQRFRAIRLVVDTGLHAKRWSREQAINWAVANAGRTLAAMTSEIDRYTSSPGQACGYKIGHNEINRLRDKAKVALGAKFDIRTFNDTLVRTGAVPMTVLGSEVDRLIARGGVV